MADNRLSRYMEVDNESHDDSQLTFEALTSNVNGSQSMEVFGDDDVDELIAQKRNELYQIKMRKQKARESPQPLNMADLELPLDLSPIKPISESGFVTPTKTSLTEIAHRVASHEKLLRTDRMRLTDLVSNDVHQPRNETPRSRRSSPSMTPSPSHQKQLLGQKAIHKWHPGSKRTQIPNQSTPLDIGLSSSEYDGHIGFAPDEEVIAVTNSAKRRLKALTLEMDLNNHEEEAEAVVQQVLDYGKYLGEEQARALHSDALSPQPNDYDDSRVFSDLQRKMNDMTSHLERLQDEKRVLERQQRDAERNATDMSSSLRLLSAQVSQFIHGANGKGAMNTRDLESSSEYREDLMDELRVQRKLMGDLEVEINQWRHDAEMLEQARVVEHQEHNSQIVQVVATNRLLEEKTDMQKESIKNLQEDSREWQHKLDVIWDRIIALESRVVAHDRHLMALPRPRSSWVMFSLCFFVTIVACILAKDPSVGTLVLVEICALSGYDCRTRIS